MHEWALAEAVACTVDKAYKENGETKVLRVDVLIGELQSIAMDAFHQGLETLLNDFPFGPEVFHYHTEKATFRCNACETVWLLEEITEVDEEQREAIHFLPETAHVYMSCPNCGSPDFGLKKGRGVSIASIELESP